MTTVMSRSEREEFLAEPRVGVIAIQRDEKGPLTVPVWYWYDPGGELWFETQPDSLKGRLLKIGTRISLCVQCENPPYAYVSVEGPIVDIGTDDREQHEIPMATRYLGEPKGREYIESLPLHEWKRYVLRTENWLSMNGSRD